MLSPLSVKIFFLSLSGITPTVHSQSCPDRLKKAVSLLFRSSFKQLVVGRSDLKSLPCIAQPTESLHLLPTVLTPNPLPSGTDANMVTVVVTRSGQSDTALVGSHSSIPPALPALPITWMIGFSCITAHTEPRALSLHCFQRVYNSRF